MAGAAPDIIFRPKAKKILATVLHIMKEMPKCDQYKIVKTVFLADREHLNVFGRPITFDTQWALKWGPVPSATYDLIRNKGIIVEELNLQKFPWLVKRRGKIRRYTAIRDPDYSVLSRSDITILDRIIAKLKPLSFSQVHDLAKDDPAYIEAWKRRGSGDAIAMRYDLLIDDDDLVARDEALIDLTLAR